MIRRPVLRRALLAALLAGSAVAVAADAPAPLSFDGADPDIEAADGRYYIYPTNSGGTGRLHVWTSPDRQHWQKGAELIALDRIAWIGDDGAPRHALWAPDMVAANGRHYLYFSVGPQNPTPSRIGVATCAGLEGPCTDSGKPLVTGGKGFEAIDPAVFVDPASKARYLYAGGSAGAKLRVWMLKPDMVTIEREVAVETPPHFTEGAFMHERGGTYYLSYSSGSYRHDSYQVHYATAPSPTGPWTYRGKIVESDDRFKGPGHHAFLHDPADGRWYIAYHRWEGQTGPGPYKGSRKFIVQPIAYRADGTIVPLEMR
ncbi:Glycosyl hydrolases 43 family protein [uncultured Sphingopyxis sp.]|uniref:Glycosyl hydrolases 43 family protein n=1 Tax=uncultured Sphingopyxis sp. TaxID=310581 RepID=A0A1Y5PNM6_9SPHN|nr:family 43 glycosylhydrolase [uncultured Sphingopyxis sp.]SBV31570.1 Glycosyl hydrolases 43 family protein [uncultured Sphingopyxis sp.]